jgi:hypothetical protein
MTETLSPVTFAATYICLFIGVLKIVLNGSFLFLLYKNKKFRYSQDLCIIPLCLSDLLIGILSVAVGATVASKGLDITAFGAGACNFTGFMFLFCCGLSIIWSKCR